MSSINLISFGLIRHVLKCSSIKVILILITCNFYNEIHSQCYNFKLKQGRNYLLYEINDYSDNLLVYILDLHSDTIKCKSIELGVDSIQFLKDYSFEDLDTFISSEEDFMKFAQPENIAEFEMYWDNSLGILSSKDSILIDSAYNMYYIDVDTVENVDGQFEIVRSLRKQTLIDTFCNGSVYWIRNESLEDVADDEPSDRLELIGFYNLGYIHWDFLTDAYSFSYQLISVNGIPVDLSGLLKQINESIRTNKKR